MPHALDTIELPRRGRGRPTQAAQERYEDEVDRFCDLINEINSGLDFRVSSRGWCYLLEPYGLGKNEFDRAQDLINECRASGKLDMEICAEDGKRQADNVEELHGSVEEKAKAVISYVNLAQEFYQPISFWDYQDFFVSMVVEKIDLKRTTNRRFRKLYP
jgi:hypothetical protein